MNNVTLTIVLNEIKNTMLGVPEMGNQIIKKYTLLCSGFIMVDGMSKFLSNSDNKALHVIAASWTESSSNYDWTVSTRLDIIFFSK